jgi:hypothetical protein
MNMKKVEFLLLEVLQSVIMCKVHNKDGPDSKYTQKYASSVELTLHFKLSLREVLYNLYKFHHILLKMHSFLRDFCIFLRMKVQF